MTMPAVRRVPPSIHRIGTSLVLVCLGVLAPSPAPVLADVPDPWSAARQAALGHLDSVREAARDGSIGAVVDAAFGTLGVEAGADLPAVELAAVPADVPVVLRDPVSRLLGALGVAGRAGSTSVEGDPVKLGGA